MPVPDEKGKILPVVVYQEEKPGEQEIKNGQKVDLQALILPVASQSSSLVKNPLFR